MKHIEINIKGKVQGVSYRAATKAVADQLGVKGLIMNQANGSVFVVAEGDSVALEMFLDWCNEGPQYAEVTSVETIEGELKNYRNFEIVKKVL
jgi:acylphosphatase